MLHFGKVPKKFGENLARFSKKFSKILAKLQKFFKNQQKFQQFLMKKLRLENGFDSKTVQRSALCRSRRELSNAYFVAEFGFDTAENEP